MIGEPFVQHLQVTADAIDANGHVNNVVYLSWMQEVAIAHSHSTGATRAARDAGGTWVVREHTIEYLRPLFENDNVEVTTWIDNAQAVRSTRRYEFKHIDSGKTVARGRTMWVFVDATSGRPRAIPDEVLTSFNTTINAR